MLGFQELSFMKLTTREDVSIEVQMRFLRISTAVKALVSTYWGWGRWGSMPLCHARGGRRWKASTGLIRTRNHLKTTLAALTWHWHHFRYGYAAEAHSALETDDMPRDAGVNSGGTSQQSLNSNLIRVLETTRSSPQSKPQVQKTIIILCIGTSPSRGWKRLGFSRYGIIYESIHWDCSL